MLRQREEPPEAIPEDGGREEGENKISSALLLVFWGVKTKISQLLFCGKEGRWKGKHHAGFYPATEEMPPKGLSVLPLTEKGGEAGISQFKSSVTTPGAGRAPHPGEHCQDRHIPSQPLASQQDCSLLHRFRHGSLR